MMKKVAVMMGSDSDLEIVAACIETLDTLDIPRDVHVMSAHRTPDAVATFVRGARHAGFGVMIAAAALARRRWF